MGSNGTHELSENKENASFGFFQLLDPMLWIGLGQTHQARSMGGPHTLLTHISLPLSCMSPENLRLAAKFSLLGLVMATVDMLSSLQYSDWDIDYGPWWGDHIETRNTTHFTNSFENNRNGPKITVICCSLTSGWIYKTFYTLWHWTISLALDGDTTDL